MNKKIPFRVTFATAIILSIYFFVRRGNGFIGNDNGGIKPHQLKDDHEGEPAMANGTMRSNEEFLLQQNRSNEQPRDPIIKSTANTSVLFAAKFSEGLQQIAHPPADSSTKISLLLKSKDPGKLNSQLKFYAEPKIIASIWPVQCRK